MKRILITLIFFLCLLTIYSQGEDSMRFDVDLEVLSTMSDSQIDQLIENENLLVIDGILSSFFHEGDQIILTVLNGKWKGTESVQYYQAKIILSAAEWSNAFPERPPRNPGNEIIHLNSYILVLGKMTSSEYEDGFRRVILNAVDLRVISQ